MSEEATEVCEDVKQCRFLSVEDTMLMLHVSRSTLYGLIERKQNPLPSVRVGKSRRFPFDKVRSWMEALDH
jgi:excisionase family DNA binding protein